jgi:hypothetical protein
MVIRWIIFRPNLDIELHTSIWTFVIRFRQITFSTKLLHEFTCWRTITVYVDRHCFPPYWIHYRIDRKSNFWLQRCFLRTLKSIHYLSSRKRKSFHYSDYPCFWSSIEGFLNLFGSETEPQKKVKISYQNDKISSGFHQF